MSENSNAELESITPTPFPAVSNLEPTALVSPMDQLTNAMGLLKLLWDDTSRPSLRWLRSQTKRSTIPCVRSGGRVWFIPREVREALAYRPARRGRPRGT